VRAGGGERQRGAHSLQATPPVGRKTLNNKKKKRRRTVPPQHLRIESPSSYCLPLRARASLGSRDKRVDQWGGDLSRTAPTTPPDRLA